MRARSQTTGSNGQSSARPVIRRGTRRPHPVGGPLPAPHPDLLQLARLHQLGHRLLAARRGEAVVVAQVGLGGHAQRLGGAQHQSARCIVGARRRRGQHGRRQHPLGQVVEPLEVVAGAVVRAPVPKRYSQMRLTSDRSHHDAPGGRGRVGASSAFSSAPAPIGPSSLTAARMSSTRPGCRSTTGW
ncbi:hypothetical protein BJF90_38785 [Pseudonocardia sp. CNS-004]|nr:hypothetical protein BJF90_38785 [Pseudonocardia sp. CNS-004]